MPILQTASVLADRVAAVYNAGSGSQSHVVAPPRLRKPLVCVAAGESGHQPAVFVWDLAAMTFLSELKGYYKNNRDLAKHKRSRFSQNESCPGEKDSKRVNLT